MKDTSDLQALSIVCSGTGACVTFALAWAVGARRGTRRRVHLTGRAAVPYWHSPTGLQDERGIRSFAEPQS